MMRARDLKPLLAILSGGRPIASLFNDVGERLGNRLLILHDQNQCRLLFPVRVLRFVWRAFFLIRDRSARAAASCVPVGSTHGVSSGVFCVVGPRPSRDSLSSAAVSVPNAGASLTRIPSGAKIVNSCTVLVVWAENRILITDRRR